MNRKGDFMSGLSRLNSVPKQLWKRLVPGGRSACAARFRERADYQRRFVDFGIGDGDRVLMSGVARVHFL